MAEVTYEASEQFSAMYRRVKWVATGADTYYVWRNGLLVGQTQIPWFDVYLRPGEAVEIAVYNSASDRPPASYPNYAVIAWENPLVKGSPIAATAYRIDEYADSAWAERQRIADTGLTFYSWPTAILADATEHKFCVTPIAASGAEGLALEYSILMVRCPDPPGATYSLGEGGVVTVG